MLLAIHTRGHTYDPSQLFTPWVYAIARYKLVDYLRRTRTSSKDVPVSDTEELSGPDDQGQVESNLDLGKLLAELSPKLRRAIQYVKLDGLSVSEAAHRSGMSESAIKVSVHRGLKALARAVGRDEKV
jgi:RNA polymerase sigma-70 factor, ECF subfamily